LQSLIHWLVVLVAGPRLGVVFKSCFGWILIHAYLKALLDPISMDSA
jgi:hypothetical protein